MFWTKNKENTCRYNPAFPSFAKVGFKGVYMSQACYSDGSNHPELKKVAFRENIAEFSESGL